MWRPAMSKTTKNETVQETQTNILDVGNPSKSDGGYPKDSKQNQTESLILAQDER